MTEGVSSLGLQQAAPPFCAATRVKLALAEQRIRLDMPDGEQIFISHEVFQQRIASPLQIVASQLAENRGKKTDGRQEVTRFIAGYTPINNGPLVAAIIIGALKNDRSAWGHACHIKFVRAFGVGHPVSNAIVGDVTDQRRLLLTHYV